jgi:hypothetical protein
MRLLLSVLIVGLLLSACSTYVTPRYSLTADTNIALKSVGASNVAVGSFSGPPNFDSACRAAGPLATPDGMSHAAYIKKALEDELKVGGAYAASSPRVTLSGVVNKLDFSSARAITGGSWNIDLTLSSSNGKSMLASEHYEFESGYGAETACKQTAEAFMPAVQDLIAKIVRAPEFRSLTQ